MTEGGGRHNPRVHHLLLVLVFLIGVCGTVESQTAPAAVRRSAPQAILAPPAARTLHIYLARHGETGYNAEGRVQGQLDIPLNDKGRAQAAALRDTVKGIHFDAVYSSTLSRSRETARIANAGRVRSLDSLRERNQGRFQGMASSDPEFARRSQDPGDALDGGESLEQLTGRARAALAQIRREHPAGNVLVVGHLIVNQMILRVLMNLPMATAERIQQSNDELYKIDLTAGFGPRLWKLIRPSNLGDL